MKIACVGDNCIDYYEKTGEVYPGGNPVNVAVYTQRLGGKASYIGAVGTDDNGRLLTGALEARGVDTSHVHIKPGSTALTYVSINNGERVLGDYVEGVMADFKLTDEDIAFICAHDIAVSGLWGKAEGDLGKIHAHIPVAFDCAQRPEDEVAQIALPHTDIAFFSDDSSSIEALKLRIKRIFALGPSIVVATRGANGSLAYDGNSFYNFGIINCAVVDTMGAGDSYIAGFINAWLNKKPIRNCMEAGANSSAVTLGYKGAW